MWNTIINSQLVYGRKAVKLLNVQGLQCHASDLLFKALEPKHHSTQGFQTAVVLLWHLSSEESLTGIAPVSFQWYGNIKPQTYALHKQIRRPVMWQENNNLTWYSYPSCHSANKGCVRKKIVRGSLRKVRARGWCDAILFGRACFPFYSWMSSRLDRPGLPEAKCCDTEMFAGRGLLAVHLNQRCCWIPDTLHSSTNGLLAAWLSARDTHKTLIGPPHNLVSPGFPKTQRCSF